MSLPNWSTQLPGSRQVVSLGFEEIKWGYGEEPMMEPRCFFGRGRGYSFKIDPAPVYGHDLGQIEELLEACHADAPLCNPVTVNVLRVSDKRGSNGWAQQNWSYHDCHTPDDCQCDVELPDGKTRRRNWDGVIALSGRTTEIHPAIARYVVPHEYGHIAEDALALIRHDDGSADPGDALLSEWAKVRRIPQEFFELPYGTTTHHLIPREVFANDFRFALGYETEWWPHDEVVPPLGARGTKRAQTWWEEALAQLADCFKEATSGA